MCGYKFTTRLLVYLKTDYVIYVIAFMLVISNMSSFILTFGITDDYWHLFQSLNSNNSSLLEFHLANGRPLNGYLLELIFARLRYISDFHYLRYLSFLGILIWLFILYLILNLFDLNILEKFAILLLLTSLPAINLYISWGVCVAVPYALILSTSSAILIKLVIINHDFNIYRHHYKYYFFSIILSISSLLIYQPAAMYYWVISFLFLFFPYNNHNKAVERIENNNKISFNNFLRYLIIWTTSLISYYGLVILFFNIRGIHPQRFSLLNWEDIRFKILWFIHEVIPRSINLNILSENKNLPLLVIIIIILGVFTNSIPLRQKFFRIGMYATYIAFTYFPNLVVSENWASYRTQTAISSIFILMFILSLRSIVHKKHQYYKLYLIIIIIISISNSILYNYVQLSSISYPQSLELAYLKSQLEEAIQKKSNNIYILRSDWSDSISTPLYDEFGFPSSYPNFSISSMSQLLIREIKPTKKVNIIILNRDAKLINLGKKDYIIKMSSIKSLKIQGH